MLEHHADDDRERVLAENPVSLRDTCDLKAHSAILPHSGPCSSAQTVRWRFIGTRWAVRDASLPETFVRYELEDAYFRLFADDHYSCIRLQRLINAPGSTGRCCRGCDAS